ncbi:MAG: AAA family ATPase [Stygiobacter sp.]|jgi:wobble nucleotide-excising tRNase
MIKEIKLNNVATFTEDVIINDLKKINFFFGANGSGKTTISKVIANPGNYNQCELTLENNNKNKIIVFNEEFIQNYFYTKDLLNGIYTIGEGAKDIEEKITQKVQEKKTLQHQLDNLKLTKKQKENEQTDSFGKFKEKCWEIGYLKLESYFSNFFTGYRNSKKNFADKLLEEYNSNKSDLLDLEQLKEKYNLIYDETIQRIDLITEISKSDIEKLQSIEINQTILNTAIIGKKDVDIAKMIEKLHNHDWVKKGKEYYDQNYNDTEKAYICPFCQQKTSDEFRKQLEDYFDESYNQQINELKEFKGKYETLTKSIKNYFETLLTLDHKYINTQKNQLQDKIKIFVSTINNNFQILEKKENNPSEKLTIENVSNYFDEISKFIDEINKKIKNHNDIIENKSKEKSSLESQIWKYIVEQLKNEIENYNKNKTDIEKALNNLISQITEKENKINGIDIEVSELEKQIKSVKPTIDSINKILESFGFKGFKLKSTDDGKHYQIVRNDGTDAKKTLSEGERNFLVFIYFYNLIYGVENPDENINQDKILIIDDPVSSLDSEVLFIVSTLIKNILDKVRGNKDSVKQMLIFTHNAYFFKEITFISSRESCYNKRNDTMYYIVRKKDNISFLDKYDTCPIKTSYQLLWDDIKRENIDCVSIQNSMRRIIEFYFKFLAGINENELLEKFEGEDKNICKSLIAFINAGSHEIIDDFNVTITNDNLNKFKENFKKIFEVTQHLAHYDMMMNKES